MLSLLKRPIRAFLIVPFNIKRIAMFQIRIKHTSKDPVWIVPPKISIGSANDNDLVLKNPGILPHHLELQVKNDKVFVYTEESANEFFINENKAAPNAELHAGDVLKVNNTEIELLLPEQNVKSFDAAVLDSNADKWFIEAINGIHKGKRYKLKKSTLFGRSEQCDVQLQDDKISRQHARLDIIGGALKITDMGSANGSYINNNKITSSYARSEDQLKLGDSEFKIIGPFLDSNKTTISTPLRNEKDQMPKTAADMSKAALSVSPKETIQDLKAATYKDETKHKASANKTSGLIIAAGVLLSVGAALIWFFQK